MASWKRASNDTFIKMVKCNRILYDMTHPDYKNIFKKNKIWDQIGQKCRISGDEAKAKWKNLRDTYSKYLKSSRAPTEHNSVKGYNRYGKWQWASSMDFLKHSKGNIITDTNLAREGDNVSDTQHIKITNNDKNKSNSENPLQRSISVASPKRCISRCGSRKSTFIKQNPVDKITTYLNTKADEFSSTEHVMLGYAKTIDSFSARRKIITKMKIAQVMMEAELEEEQERILQRETPILGSSYTIEPSTSQNERCISQQSCYSRSHESANESGMQDSLNCIQGNALGPPLTKEDLDYKPEIDVDE